MTEPYAPPLDQLLTFGEPEDHNIDSIDYLALGITEEHVPELLRMLDDPALGNESASEVEQWAPIHAGCALGQLGSEAAVPPLVDRLVVTPESDWNQEFIAEVLGRIGSAAIEPLSALIHNKEVDEFTAGYASLALAQVARNHPDARDAAMAGLVRALENYADNGPQVNGHLIAHLLDAHYLPAAPLMEAAFAAGAVDKSIPGDWEDAQVELGLLAERITPRPRILHVFDPPSPLPAGPRPYGGRTTTKAKSQKKAARNARKKNRRK